MDSSSVDTTLHTIVLVFVFFAFFTSTWLVFHITRAWRRRASDTDSDGHALFIYGTITLFGLLQAILSAVQIITVVVAQDEDIQSLLSGCHVVAILSHICWIGMQASVVVSVAIPQRSLSLRDFIQLRGAGLFLLTGLLTVIGIKGFGNDMSLCYADSTKVVIPIILISSTVTTFIIVAICSRHASHPFFFAMLSFLTVPYALILLLLPQDTLSDPGYLMAARTIFVLVINLAGAPLLAACLIATARRQGLEILQEQDYQTTTPSDNKSYLTRKSTEKSSRWSSRKSTRKSTPIQPNPKPNQRFSDIASTPTVDTWGDSQVLPSAFASKRHSDIGSHINIDTSYGQISIIPQSLIEEFPGVPAEEQYLQRPPIAQRSSSRRNTRQLYQEAVELR